MPSPRSQVGLPPLERPRGDDAAWTSSDRSEIDDLQAEDAERSADFRRRTTVHLTALAATARHPRGLDGLVAEQGHSSPSSTRRTSSSVVVPAATSAAPSAASDRIP